VWRQQLQRENLALQALLEAQQRQNDLLKQSLQQQQQPGMTSQTMTSQIVTSPVMTSPMMTSPSAQASGNMAAYPRVSQPTSAPLSSFSPTVITVGDVIRHPGPSVHATTDHPGAYAGPASGAGVVSRAEEVNTRSRSRSPANRQQVQVQAPVGIIGRTEPRADVVDTAANGNHFVQVTCYSPLLY